MTQLDENEIFNLLELSSDEGEEDLVQFDSDFSCDDSLADPDYHPELQKVEEASFEDIVNIENSVPQKRKRVENLEKSKNRVSDSNTVNKVNVIAISEAETVLGKNGFKWNTKCSDVGKKIPQKNVVHIRPGPTARARLALEPVNCFKLFISDPIIDIIILHTNQEIGKQRRNYKCLNHTVSDITREEFSALLGLLVLSAAMKTNHLTTTNLFDRSYSGDRYIAIMSEARFKFLINCLRFDDSTREQRLVGNKLAPISDIWEILLKNCRDNYKASSYVTIDEQFLGFRGNCSFRKYIPSKPNKYGIKIVEMCDNSTKYLLDAIFYVGKGTVEAGKPVAATLVNRLVESIKGSNHNVTMDNWFSSIPLVITMLNEKKLTVVCTVKQNKPEFPKDFTNPKLKNRPVG